MPTVSGRPSLLQFGFVNNIYSHLHVQRVIFMAFAFLN